MTATAISRMCTSSPTAATTGPAMLATTAMTTIAATSSSRPLPPPVVCHVPCMSTVPFLLVAGGGALAVADLECEPVKGAGAAALDVGRARALDGDACLVGFPTRWAQPENYYQPPFCERADWMARMRVPPAGGGWYWRQ
jgi:hypothetical protein